MTRVVIYKDGDRFRGFECLGHSGYGESGEDIVCAGISALTITAVNALDQLTDEAFSLETEEERGLIRLMLSENAGHDAELLIRALILGLQGILHDYGKRFIRIDFKEV